MKHISKAGLLFSYLKQYHLFDQDIHAQLVPTTEQAYETGGYGRVHGPMGNCDTNPNTLTRLPILVDSHQKIMLDFAGSPLKIESTTTYYLTFHGNTNNNVMMEFYYLGRLYLARYNHVNQSNNNNETDASNELKHSNL